MIQSNHFRRSDAVSEYLLNTNFETPDTNGDKPESWHFDDPNISYNFAASTIDVLNCTNKEAVRLYSDTTTPILPDDEYKFEFEVSNLNHGRVALVVPLENPSNSSNTDFWRTAYYDTNGVHQATIKLDAASKNGTASGYYWSSKQQKPFLRFLTSNPELVDMNEVNTAEGQTTSVATSTHTSGDAWEVEYENKVWFKAENAVDADIINSHKENVRFFNAQANSLATNESHSVTMRVTAFDNPSDEFVGYIGLRLDGSPAASNTNESGSSDSIKKSRVYTYMDLSTWHTVDTWSADQAARIISYGKQVLPAGADNVPEFTFNMYTPNSAEKVDIEIVSTDGTKISNTHLFCKVRAEVNANDAGIEMSINNVSLENTNTSNARVKLKVSSIDGIPQKVPFGDTELKYAIDLGNEKDSLFEFKFPRFATRYKYQDGEYSTFSTFSQPAFIPGTFDYHPKKGYNLAMRNRLKKITLKNLHQNIPHGVVSIDVLYKEEGSTVIYLVETLKKDKWSGDYEIEAETISSIIPSNQLLRPWDNVPRKALAQDVVGGRITYGNYLYQHDLVDNTGSDYFPNIDFNFESETLTNSVAKSVKSLREYQLGVVFVDEFGRETPVISSKSVSSKISKSNANKANVVSASFKDSNFVRDMKYFKFFIKETSGEYYNMAMDRYWDADDDHVWVSFPSSDRNKIDIDSFLILKKGIQTTNAVTETARYKVIDIKNEAPDFIKIKKELVEKKTHVYDNDEASTNVFNNDLVDAPLSGRDSFKLNYGPFANSSGSELHKAKEKLYVEFCDQTEETVSKRYRVTSLTTDFKGFGADTGVDYWNAFYSFKLDKILGEDVNFIANSTGIKDTTIVKIYKYVAENTPEFDGRFFVKIVNDTTFQTNINENVTTSNSFRVLKTQKLYYMANDHETTHAGATTGHVDGLYANKLGRYACYFRNYNYPEDGTHLESYNVIPYSRDKGRYKFGKANNNDWKNELLFTEQSAGAIGSISYAATTRDADSQSVDDSVWFIDEGTFQGSRSNFALNWSYIGNATGSNGGVTENGPNSFSTINLAFGGIYDDFEPTSSSTSVSDFFDIGRDNGNTNHNDVPTKRLVEQLQPAKKFRFREDPTNTVYTIQPTIGFEQLLRYNDGGDPWSANAQQQARFSHNFTRNWRIRVANADANAPTPGKLVWDPTGGGTRGPIANGLVLSIEMTTAVAVATGGIAVGVDNLEGTHTDGSKHEITVGMMLTSHSSEASGNDTLTGIGDKDFLIIWKIENITGGGKALYLTGYTEPISSTHDMISTNPAALNGELTFKQPAMNGYSQWSENRINLNDPNGTIALNGQPALYAVGYHMEFVEAIVEETELPDNPAIWETEPKENVALDVYYEASGLNAVELTDETISEAIPLGSTLSKVGSDIIPDGVFISSIDTSGVITLSQSVLTGNFYLEVGDEVRVSKADGSSIDLTITALGSTTNNRTNQITVNTNLYGNKTTYNLNWSNCYSFGNGVESNRIGDNFNLPFISNGVKVSSTLEEGDYKEQRRKYGLIYSGLYNSISGVNSLNQFIAAEKITKDVNPVYGSIQKLHQRNSDLVVFCENKVLKMLANKDAVFNADGNPQLTANNRVLGQTLPFSGEYGISRNPESFASDSYRAYFTDKTRGSVLRLSMDGITPISSAGMKDWFKDNLKLNNTLIGSYDDDKEEYNITLKDTSNTVSFKEEVKGWVSFKSFSSMEMGVSCGNEYYTFDNSNMWKHNSDEVNRGSFYGEENGCSISFVMNEEPNIVKTFSTLNYEGTQSQQAAVGFTNEVDGWFAQSIQTNKQEGTLLEFVEKEGKWFGYISGDENSTIDDFGSFHVKGIGQASLISSNTITYDAPVIPSLSVGDKIGANGYVNVEVEKVIIANQVATFVQKYFWFNQEAMENSRFNGEPYKSGITVKMLKDTGSGTTVEEVEVKLFKNNGLYSQDDDNGIPLAYGRLSNGNTGNWTVNDVLFANKIPSTLGVVKSVSSDKKVITLEGNVYSTPPLDVTIYYIENTDLTPAQQGRAVSGKYFWFKQQDMQDSVFGGDTYNSGKVVIITKRNASGNEETVRVKLFKDNGSYSKEDTNGVRYAYGRKQGGQQPYYPTAAAGDWVTSDVLFGETGVVEVDTSKTPIYTYCQKNQYVENSGLIGYYATINLENHSPKKAELFSFGSNVTKSS